MNNKYLDDILLEKINTYYTLKKIYFALKNEMIQNGGFLHKQAHIKQGTQTNSTNKFTIRSSSFKNKGIIPDEYSRYYQNHEPNIEWTNIPESTKDLLLICYDPDAEKIAGKIWIHWIVYDINLTTHTLEENKYKIGKNSFKENKYDGPQPPDKKSHSYFFTLYALNEKISVNQNKQYEFNDIEELVKDKVNGQASIMGYYKNNIKN